MSRRGLDDRPAFAGTQTGIALRTQDGPPVLPCRGVPPHRRLIEAMLTPQKPHMKLIATAAAALTGACAATAVAASAPDGQEQAAGEVAALERPTEHLKRSIDLHEERVQRLRERREERREARQPELASPESYGVSQSTLDAIASCESGGDPAAVSSDGTYRGKYQFDSSTWAAMGGSGDPAAAPEAEQDMRAAMLYSQSGSSPWPICGA